MGDDPKDDPKGNDPSHGVISAGDPRNGLDPLDNGYPPCTAHLITDFGVVSCGLSAGHEKIRADSLHQGTASLIDKTYTWDSIGEDRARMKYAIGLFVVEPDLDGAGD
jgi:hypothetical protein